MYDVIIIGAGPAGISAGLYAKRAGLNVLILYHGNSDLEKSSKIENYYGFVDGISGKELYENGISQAKKIGIDVIDEEVIDIMPNFENKYIVKTSINVFNSKSIILATGNKKIKPNIIRN